MRRILALAILVCPLAAQAPRVGDINFYGLHKVTQGEILKATGLESGGTLPPSKGNLEDKLEQLPDVLEARVEAVCCQGDHTAIFIGIAEKGQPYAAFRSDPAGDATLPPELLQSYQQFLGAFQRAAAHGNTAEDLTAGHSVMDDPAARAFQAQFVDYASAHLDTLRKALHDCPEPDARAAAAAIIGYGPQTQAVIDDLQYALDDPDAAVRANAIRSLQGFIVYAQKHPAANLKIESTWLVELLHSVDLSDREQSTKALVMLTEPTAPAAMRDSALELIRERAMPTLAEMARWPTLSYALPPFLIMGRIAGLPDRETQLHWANGDRETVVQKALDTVIARAKRPGK